MAISFVDVTERRRPRTLSGILSICLYCKRIRDAEGTWWPVDVYGRHHSEALFSHGLCPECVPRLRQQFGLTE